MGGKRKLGLSHPADEQRPPKKPEMHASNAHGEPEASQRNGFDSASAPLDPDYGQRGAFPELDQRPDGDDLFYAPAGDGMEYIKMVRSEAQSVPKLLTIAASKPPGVGIARHEQGTIQGFYEDGAYFAASPRAADGNGVRDAAPEEEASAQEAYYAALKARFTQFRQHVTQMPTGAKSMSKSSTPLALLGTAKRAQFEHALRHAPPALRSLGSASQDDIVRGLGRIESLLSARIVVDPAEGPNLGSWSWALLAKCRDPGAMHSEQIGVVRQLGKRALVVAYTLSRKRQRVGPYGEKSNVAVPLEEEARPLEASDDRDTTNVQEEESSTSDEAPELESLKRALLARIEEREQREHAGNWKETEGLHKGTSDEEGIVRGLGLLDMIITVVGEAFGQRDLLDQRVAW